MTNLRSPGITINEREINRVEEGVTGIPATVFGTAQKGRAFVPHTLGQISQLTSRFGEVTADTPGLHAAYRFLENRNALTFVRVLGAGVNSGFKVDEDAIPVNFAGAKHFFLSAKHTIDYLSTESPYLSSIEEQLENGAVLLRAHIVVADGFELTLQDQNVTEDSPARAFEVDSGTASEFYLIVTNSTGYRKDYLVSLNVNDSNYLGRALNSNPEKLAEEGLVLWREFYVDQEVALVEPNNYIYLDCPTIGALSNTAGLVDSDPAANINQTFGKWDSNYREARSPWVTSQPFSASYSDDDNIVKLVTKRLLKFHTIDDGTTSSHRVKVSISGLRTSSDPTSPYPTFNVSVRKWDDSDLDPVVYESFVQVDLNPNSERYVARVIGDLNYSIDWSKEELERRIVVRGNYPNRSEYIWVEMHPEVEQGLVPVDCIPFGYESLDLPRVSEETFGRSKLEVIPPIFRTKITSGPRNKDLAGIFGKKEFQERLEQKLHWGVQWEKTGPTNLWNSSRQISPYMKAVCSYNGNPERNTLYSGKEASHRYDAEFSLAFVGLPASTVSDLRNQKPARNMLEAAYLRGNTKTGIESSSMTIEANSDFYPEYLNMVTLATVLIQDPALFNQYSQFAKFTVPLQGGWDGVNPFWSESAKMSDRASSVLDGETSDWTPGFGKNTLGEGEENIVVQSLQFASVLVSDPNTTNTNIVATPGYREPEITDFFSDLSRDIGLWIYIMDIPSYSENDERIFTGQKTRPDVEATIQELGFRNIDNSHIAIYFPDMLAPIPNGKIVQIPPSVAALAAIGFNDRVGGIWFAPAGFNRASLAWAQGPIVRLNKANRDDLYDISRINPIFSGKITENENAILGQKTQKLSTGPLSRIAIRRAVNECKRIVREGMLRYAIWEAADAQTRASFVSNTLQRLNSLRQGGARNITLICDDTNNSPEDEQNRIVRATVEFTPIQVAENIVFDILVSRDGDFSFLER